MEAKINRVKSVVVSAVTLLTLLGGTFTSSSLVRAEEIKKDTTKSEESYNSTTKNTTVESLKSNVAVKTSIPVSCVAENSGEKFTYILKHLTTDSYIKDHEAVAISSLELKNGTSDYFVIWYDYPGTYSYEITQTAGSATDTTYDDAVYTVDVYVTEDEKGKLHTEPIIYKKGTTEKFDSASFTNVVTIKSDNKKTGDYSSLAVWASIMVVSAFIGAILYIKRGKETS